METNAPPQRDTAKPERWLRNLFIILTVINALWLMVALSSVTTGHARPYDICNHLTGVLLCGSYLPRSPVVRYVMLALSIVSLGLQFWLR